MRGPPISRDLPTLDNTSTMKGHMSMPQMVHLIYLSYLYDKIKDKVQWEININFFTELKGRDRLRPRRRRKNNTIIY
jgi:hypothetical protein